MDDAFTRVLLIGTDGVPYEIGASGGVSQADNSAFTAGTDSGTPAMGYVGSDAVTAGRVGVVRMQATRELAVALYDASGNQIATLPISHAALTELAAAINASSQMDVNIAASAATVTTAGDVAHDDADSGNPIKIGGKASSTAPTAVTTNDRVNAWYSLNGAQVVTLGASAGVSADALTTMLVPISADGLSRPLYANPLFNGTTFDRTPGSAANGMLVNLGANNDVSLNAGTNAIGKLAANSGVDIGDVDVTSLPALVAGTAYIGKVLPPDRDITLHTNYAKKYYTSTGAATDGIVWSPAAGTRWHVVSMYLQTSAAATITLEDDLAGGDSVVWKGEFAANQGMTIHWGSEYPLASGEDAADLLITTSAGNIYVTCVGYEI